MDLDLKWFMIHLTLVAIRVVYDSHDLRRIIVVYDGHSFFSLTVFFYLVSFFQPRKLKSNLALVPVFLLTLPRLLFDLAYLKVPLWLMSGGERESNQPRKSDVQHRLSYFQPRPSSF